MRPWRCFSYTVEDGAHGMSSWQTAQGQLLGMRTEAVVHLKSDVDDAETAQEDIL